MTFQYEAREDGSFVITSDDVPAKTRMACDVDRDDEYFALLKTVDRFDFSDEGGFILSSGGNSLATAGIYAGEINGANGGSTTTTTTVITGENGGSMNGGSTNGGSTTTTTVTTGTITTPIDHKQPKQRMVTME